jgi:hypothetical protein
MSEYPSDEGTPIPFVKIYGDLIVAPAPTVQVGDDVFLSVELINMGTAPTKQGDQLWGSLIFSGTVIHQDHVDFPEIGPNGSTWRHGFKFDGHYVMSEGTWMLAASVTNAGTIGEVQDDQRVEFTVSPREYQ